MIPVADIATDLIDRYGDGSISHSRNRWVGSILRKRLNIRTYKTHGVYVVPMQERPKIELLCKRYRVDPEAAGRPEQGRRDVGTP